MSHDDRGSEYADDLTSDLEDDLGDGSLSSQLKGEVQYQASEQRLAAPGYPHTEACAAAQREHEKQAAAYRAAWPTSCTACNGWGVEGAFDDVVGCPTCVENGLCPRCGEVAWGKEDEGGECPLCGWDGSDGIEAAPLCACSSPAASAGIAK